MSRRTGRLSGVVGGGGGAGGAGAGAPTAPTIPPILCGFNVIKKLGQGGYGIVYEVEDSKKKRWAMKISKELKSGVGIPANLIGEAAIGQALSHPFLVATRWVGSCTEEKEDEEVVAIQMELVNGGDLLTYINRVQDFYRQVREKPTAVLRIEFVNAEVKRRVRILEEIACAISFMHLNSLVHHDLKPENVFVVGDTRFGSLPETLINIKVGDFGLAELLNSDRKCIQCGTRIYLPPESLMLDQFGAAGDLWSLGLIAYSLFFGESFIHPIGDESDLAIINAMVGRKGWPPHNMFPAPPALLKPELTKERTVAQMFAAEGRTADWVAFYGQVLYDRILFFIDGLVRYNPTERRIDLTALKNAVGITLAVCPVVPAQIIHRAEIFSADEWVPLFFPNSSRAWQELFKNIWRRLRCSHPTRFAERPWEREMFALSSLTSKLLGPFPPWIPRGSSSLSFRAEEIATTERLVLDLLGFNLLVPACRHLPRPPTTMPPPMPMPPPPPGRSRFPQPIPPPSSPPPRLTPELKKQKSLRKEEEEEKGFPGGFKSEIGTGGMPIRTPPIVLTFRLEMTMPGKELDLPFTQTGATLPAPLTNAIATGELSNNWDLKKIENVRGTNIVKIYASLKPDRFGDVILADPSSIMADPKALLDEIQEDIRGRENVIVSIPTEHQPWKIFLRFIEAAYDHDESLSAPTTTTPGRRARAPYRGRRRRRRRQQGSRSRSPPPPPQLTRRSARLRGSSSYIF